MKPRARAAVMAIGVALGLALLSAFGARAAEDPTVQQRDKEVKRGDKGTNPQTPMIDWESDEELEKKNWETVEDLTTSVKITSIPLQPPEGNWSFEKFKDDPSLYVEVVVGAEQGWDVITQNTQTIQFWGTAPKDTSDNWPVKAEGNLESPPGGPGTQEFHWSAKVATLNVGVTAHYNINAVERQLVVDTSGAVDFFRILGGMRAKMLVAVQPEGLTITAHNWQKDAGVFFWKPLPMPFSRQRKWLNRTSMTLITLMRPPFRTRTAQRSIGKAPSQQRNPARTELR